MNFCNELTKVLDLRFREHDEQACASCQFYRIHTTGAAVSCCLLLGRDLCMGGDVIRDWDQKRMCDGWLLRPEAWDIHTHGIDTSPYWHDPYISRDEQHDHRIAVFYRQWKRARLAALEEAMAAMCRGCAEGVPVRWGRAWFKGPQEWIHCRAPGMHEPCAAGKIRALVGKEA